MNSILNASFKYTPSFGTDIKKTFEKIRQEQAARAKPAAQVLKVTPMLRVA